MDKYNSGGKGLVQMLSKPSRHTKPRDVVEVSDFFFKNFQALFDEVGDTVRSPRGKNIAAAAEAVTVQAIQEQLDNVVVALHTTRDLTDRSYIPGIDQLHIKLLE